MGGGGEHIGSIGMRGRGHTLQGAQLGQLMVGRGGGGSQLGIRRGEGKEG